jgi:hypothetical protein
MDEKLFSLQSKISPLYIVHRNIIWSFCFFLWKSAQNFSYACRKREDNERGHMPEKETKRFQAASGVLPYRLVAG